MFAGEVESNSSFNTEINSNTSNEDAGESESEDYYMERESDGEDPDHETLKAIRKRMRRMNLASDRLQIAAAKKRKMIKKHKNKGERIAEEMHSREHYLYLNQKYIKSMRKNPVLVMPSLEL